MFSKRAHSAQAFGALQMEKFVAKQKMAKVDDA
jgi:hypothetical protein